MVAQFTNPPTETRAQKDARLETSINEHNRVLHELIGKMVGLEDWAIASVECNKASVENIKKTFSVSLDDIRYLIVDEEAQQSGATWSVSGILRSGSSTTTRALHTQAPPFTLSPVTFGTYGMILAKERELIMEGRDKHIYCINKMRFFGTDIANWLFWFKHYFDIDDRPENARFKVTVIHLEGETLQWHQGYIKVQAIAGKTVSGPGMSRY